MEFNTYSVGQKVRVLLLERYATEEGTSCRAMIACCNDDGTYDVIYEPNSYDQSEEGAVLPVRITPLEEFETEDERGDGKSGAESQAMAAKERGNKLFQMKDFDAAREQYLKALGMATPRLPTIGSRVIVLDKIGEYVSGTLSGADADSADVIFDEEDSDGVDEEDGVPLSRVILVAPDEDLRRLQVVLFMNLAKVSLKLRRNGWAIRYASCSIGITKSDSRLVEELNKKLIDAYYFRAKVFLVVNRPGRALADAENISSSGDSARGATLARQIAVHKEQRRREDRKLARDVARWVESAMEMSAAGGSAGSDAMIVEDI